MEQADKQNNHEFRNAFMEELEKMDQLDEDWQKEMDSMDSLHKEWKDTTDKLLGDLKQGRISAEEYDKQWAEINKKFEEGSGAHDQNLKEISNQQDEALNSFNQLSDKAIDEIQAENDAFMDQLSHLNKTVECSALVGHYFELMRILSETKYRKFLDKIHEELLPVEVCKNLENVGNEKAAAEYLNYLTDNNSNPEKYKNFYEHVLDLFLDKIKQEKPEMAEYYGEFVHILNQQESIGYDGDTQLDACLRQVHSQKLLYTVARHLKWLTAFKCTPKKVKHILMRLGVGDRWSQLVRLFDDMNDKNAENILTILREVYPQK